MKTIAAALHASVSQRPRWSLLIVAAVLAGALLSFYVHLLQAHVQRGELLRSAQRAGVFDERSLSQWATVWQRERSARSTPAVAPPEPADAALVHAAASLGAPR